MPIVNNTSNSIGDEFVIKFEPIRGVSEIDTLNDTTVGETANRLFLRSFRYALRDGLFYSDWADFSVGVGLGITFSEPQIIWLEVKYTRAGSDDTGLLTLVSTDVDTVYIAMPEKTMPTSVGVFGSQVQDDTEVLQLSKNILEKLYHRGIVPQYITRGNGGDDSDYLSFWRAFSQTIALIITNNNDLKTWQYNEGFLKEHLTQLNFFVGDADLLQLRYILKHQFAEVKLRSTESIFKHGDIVNGEFLRLIAWAVGDEFIYWVDYNERRGWVVGQNSPCYKGVSRNPQLDKIKDISILRKSNTAPYNANYSVLTYNQREALMISMISSGAGALNFYEHGVSPAFSTYQDAFLVDDELDYEITFFISSDKYNQKCKFQLHTFDKDWNYLSAYTTNSGASGVGDGFFEFILPRVGDYYYFSVSLYSSNRQDYNPLATNTNEGSNFAMRRGTKHVLPSFVFDSMGENGTFYLADVRLNLASKGARLQYEYGLGARSNCFLNTNNILNVIARSNNGQYSFSKIEETAKKFLIPYNHHFILDFINKYETETNFGVLPEYIPLGDFNNDFNNDFS